ncbi:integrase, catalytic region, zinc finger, CCHC-type containing protein [Tanacetum coccineum]
MREEVATLKKDFKQKENKYLEDFLDMKALRENVKDKLFKQYQSLQTVHMLCKPKPYYDEKKKVAIGYKNLLYLTRAMQVQSALYNGHEIVKTIHPPTIVHDLKDTLEIVEKTRIGMLEKMKRTLLVDSKIKIAPPDYLKENYLATFTPQRHLTPEQTFWSSDIAKMTPKPISKMTVDSLLLTPLCCDDIHDVTPRVSALAGYDRLVSEPLVIEKIDLRIWLSSVKRVHEEDIPKAAFRTRGKVENATTEMLHGLDQLIERKEDKGMKFIWVPLIDDVRTLIMDEAHASRSIVTTRDTGVEVGDNNYGLYYKVAKIKHGVHVSIISDRGGRFTSRFWQTLQKALGTRLDMSTAYHPQTDGQSERTIQTLKDMLRASHVLWAEIGEIRSIGPELVQETTNKVILIKEKLKAARDCQKSYVGNMRKHLELKLVIK